MICKDRKFKYTRGSKLVKEILFHAFKKKTIFLTFNKTITRHRFESVYSQVALHGIIEVDCVFQD